MTPPLEDPNNKPPPETDQVNDQVEPKVEEPAKTQDETNKVDSKESLADNVAAGNAAKPKGEVDVPKLEIASAEGDAPQAVKANGEVAPAGTDQPAVQKAETPESKSPEANSPEAKSPEAKQAAGAATELSDQQQKALGTVGDSSLKIDESVAKQYGVDAETLTKIMQWHQGDNAWNTKIKDAGKSATSQESIQKDINADHKIEAALKHFEQENGAVKRDLPPVVAEAPVSTGRAPIGDINASPKPVDGSQPRGDADNKPAETVDPAAELAAREKQQYIDFMKSMGMDVSLSGKDNQIIKLENPENTGLTTSDGKHNLDNITQVETSIDGSSSVSTFQNKDGERFEARSTEEGKLDIRKTRDFQSLEAGKSGLQGVWTSPGENGDYIDQFADKDGNRFQRIGDADSLTWAQVDESGKPVAGKTFNGNVELSSDGTEIKVTDNKYNSETTTNLPTGFKDQTITNPDGSKTEIKQDGESSFTLTENGQNYSVKDGTLTVGENGQLNFKNEDFHVSIDAEGKRTQVERDTRKSIFISEMQPEPGKYNPVTGPGFAELSPGEAAVPGWLTDGKGAQYSKNLDVDARNLVNKQIKSDGSKTYSYDGDIDTSSMPGFDTTFTATESLNKNSQLDHRNVKYGENGINITFQSPDGDRKIDGVKEIDTKYDKELDKYVSTITDKQGNQFESRTNTDGTVEA
ncbi:MAG: hypothetical protein K8F91_16990, partial [Candidatus Obscuribacterales bacterium]|nr:hypothetical protein [Candidatus Obscuribacterales bacterium]